MKKTIVATIIISLIFGLTLVGCKNNNDIVATVNEKEISLDYYTKHLVLTEISYYINGVSFPTQDDELNNLKNDVLNNIIENIILADIALNRNIQIDEVEAKIHADSLIEWMLEIYGGEDNFNTFLKEKHIDRNDFEEFLLKQSKNNLSIYELYELITKDVKVTDEEALEYYTQNKKYYSNINNTIHVMSIITETKEKAEEIIADIKNNKLSFENAMDMYKNEDGVLNTSNLGIIHYNDMPEEFSDIAFSLSIGEISNPVEMYGEYYILYIYNKDIQSPMSFDEVKNDIKDNMLVEKKDKKYNDFFQLEKSNYEIKTFPNKL